LNKKLTISGIVQGVGFRPFVYQLANHFHLHGFILNDASGVKIELEGDENSISDFIDMLHENLPPLSRIDTFDVEAGEYRGYKNFQILKSEDQSDKSVLVSPDIAICKKCLEEMDDPNNRRYAYPFINCTDCGPRYSIIETLPYDRTNTSMSSFRMCEACEEEYSDPLDRRFHAQPISCPNCGPRFTLFDNKQQLLDRDNNAIKKVSGAIKEGAIIAIKGLGGFHLICDARNDTALIELRRRKQRPSKPFAVMFPDLEMIRSAALISSEERELILSKEKPIVIVSKHTQSTVSELVAPNLDRIGVFLPYTPLHHLLLQELDTPIVATSANLSNEPIICDADELVKKLGHIVDLILDHDRDILNANDDSVVQMSGEEKVTLRLSRGYTPKSIKLPFKSGINILALGANQKSSIALIIEETLIISPYIGDLNSLEAFEYFERTLSSFKRFYDFEPELIVYDKHPEYMTTRWAEALKIIKPEIQFIQLQHHYAHLLSVMAEFNLNQKVLGFSFDGTGYGDDGTIWGGEVMIADSHDYERVVTLKPFPLLGADKAIKEPRRSALSLLFETFSPDELDKMDSSTLQQFSKDDIKMLHHAWKKRINAPLCSSMGRLFDAVASLSDVIHVSSYEGESGLLMEQYVDDTFTEILPFEINNGIIDLHPMIKALVQMEDKKEIISAFFNTIVEIIFHISSKYPGYPLVFSGGVFQNRVLVKKITRRCKDENIEYYLNTETAINDGGIAVGQAWYALQQEKSV
jgi:hydrogenase maturation protein HypF